MDAPAKKGADGKHDRRRMEALARSCLDTDGALTLDNEVVDRRLEQAQPRLGFEHAAYRLPVQLPIGLRPRRANGRTLARVQRAKLDAGHIDGTRHGAAHRVDLARQVALANATDRRVAAHLSQRGEALCHQ